MSSLTFVRRLLGWKLGKHRGLMWRLLQIRNFFKKKLAAGRRNKGLKPTFAPKTNCTRWSAWIKSTIYNSNKISVTTGFFQNWKILTVHLLRYSLLPRNHQVY